jgi:hypothetical protein
MVLFDAVTQRTPEVFDAFRPAFLDGYAIVAGPLPADDVDDLIGQRVAALRSWLDDLPRAPIGIRTASPAWHAVLRSFVESYRPLGT